MVYVHTICLKPGSGFIKTSSKMMRVTEDVSGLTGNKIIQRILISAKINSAAE
jgi:hypothetical protein